jgi:hypothetical protein
MKKYQTHTISTNIYSCPSCSSRHLPIDRWCERSQSLIRRTNDNYNKKNNTKKIKVPLLAGKFTPEESVVVQQVIVINLAL